MVEKPNKVEDANLTRIYKSDVTSFSNIGLNSSYTLLLKTRTLRWIRCKYNFHFPLTRFGNISKETEIISQKIGRNIRVKSIQKAVAVYVKSYTFFALLSKNLPAVTDCVPYKNRCTDYTLPTQYPFCGLLLYLFYEMSKAKSNFVSRCLRILKIFMKSVPLVVLVCTCLTYIRVLFP